MKQETKTLRVAGILALILFLSCALAFLPQSAQALTLSTTIPVGNGVAGIAVTPNGQYVYSTNLFDGTVSVISTLSNTVATTITVGQYPMGLAITPDSEFVYVANYGGYTVSVISTATNTVNATITGFNYPTNVAVSPDGELVYITNYNGNSVSVISTDSNTVIATITGLNSPGSLAVTPDGEYLYVKSNFEGTSVLVISTGNNSVIETIPLGSGYYYYYSLGGSSEIAVSPNGEYVYVTSMDYDSNSVSVISTSNNSVIETIPLGSGYYYYESEGGSGGIAVAPNGEYIYVTRNDYDGYSVSVISTSNNTVIESVSLGESYDPYGGSGCLALTPNGEYIYAANGGWSYSNSISVISLTPSSTFAITVSQGDHGTISPGTTTVNYGAGQEFTFTPATGYHIVAVKVNGTTVATTSPYNVSDVTGATSLTAEYAIDVFTATVGDHTHGSISSTNGTTVNYGNDLSFSVTADTGYHLVSVLIDGETASAPYNFVNVIANHTISATFTIDVFTATVGDHTHGSISSTNGTTVNYGNDLSFSVTADTGYHLVSVLIDGETASAPYNFVNVIANHTISATFTIDTFAITVSQGANGVIAPGTTTVNYGAGQEFTFTPATGYHITDVLMNGTSVLSNVENGAYTVSNVTGTTSLTATYAIDTFTITVTQGDHGVIRGNTTVNYGSNQEFTFTPTIGYHIVAIKVNGTTVGTTSPYTISDVTGATSLTAEYAINTYAITITHSANGFISGPSYANYGTDASYAIVPSTSYHIVNVIVDGVYKGATASYKISNVQGTHTVTASFAVNIDAITATVTTTGDSYGVEISGNVTAHQMSNVTITPHQLSTTTIVSFTVTGPSGTVGFGNMTLQKSAILYGTNPVVYIDGNQALNQGYTQDADNFYIWYTTYFSTHEMTILFTSTPSATPTATLNPPASMSLNVPVMGAIILIGLVLIGLLVKRKKNQNPQVLS
jgi:YVTN family beta-propeller protein